MTKEFDYHSFPDEFNSEPLNENHFPEAARILNQAIAEENYSAIEARAGYLTDRRGNLNFIPLGIDAGDRKYYKSEDLMIQINVRMNSSTAAKLGLIALEETLIAETKEAEAARLEAQATQLEAAAAEAQAAANAAAEKARAARAKL